MDEMRSAAILGLVCLAKLEISWIIDKDERAPDRRLPSTTIQDSGSRGPMPCVAACQEQSKAHCLPAEVAGHLERYFHHA